MRPAVMPRAAMAVACALALSASCADTPAEQPNTDGEYELVPAGKADDYFSGVAVEYAVTGTVVLQIDAAVFDLPEAFQIFVANRVTAVGVYLSAYLSDKIHGQDENGDGEITGGEVINQNFAYGGFHAMVRNHTVEPGDVREIEPGMYAIDFELQVAGPAELLGTLPGRYVESGAYAFEFPIPLFAFQSEDFPSSRALYNFDPSAFDGELTTVAVQARPLANAGNAYPRFDAFAEDGVFDLTFAFGYDGGATRADRIAANEILGTLITLGFETPTYILDELGPGGGPLTKTMIMDGREVRVEARLLVPDAFIGDEAGHVARVLMELRDRDVFMYVGHAGPYSGFNLGPAGTAVIQPEELREAVLLEKQQLVVAQGCRTYSQYADVLYANAARSPATLDVISTVNFGYWKGTGELVRQLLAESNGLHFPRHYGEILNALNQADGNHRRSVLYGVHGIEDNPGVHPYANPAIIGRPCASTEACEDVAAHLCLGYCAIWAVRPEDCPEDSRYMDLGQGNTIVANLCAAPL